MDATIKASFWTDCRIEDAPAEVKLACLWMVTNPTRDLCGFTCATGRRFEFETGLKKADLAEACESISESFRELPGGVLFAVNFLRHQFGKGGKISPKNNVITAAVNHAKKLPEALQEAFFGAYPELDDREAPPHPLGTPLAPPPHPLTPFSQGVRVRAGAGAEQEQEQEQENLQEDGADLDESLKARLRALRPEWGRPRAFGPREAEYFAASREQIAELEPEEWETLRRFLAARVAGGAGYWQPKQRPKMLETFGDAFASAVRWASKQQTAPKVTPIHPEPTAEDREAMAEFLTKKII